MASVYNLAEPCEGVFVTAEDDGVWIRGDIQDCRNPKNRLGRLLSVLIPQLVELDEATIEDAGVKIAYPNFVDIEEHDIDAFSNVVPWSPFAIEIDTTGSLGAVDLRYKTRFYWGRDQIHTERKGCFIKRGDSVYRLDKQTYALIDAIDNFNAMPAKEKAKPRNALLAFASIKDLSEDIGAGIDRFIASQKVIIPSKVGLDMVVDRDDRITFVPKMDNVPSEGIIKAFLASDTISEDYFVDSPDGGRIRVLLNESQREVLRRMQKVRHMGGLNKAKVLSNPYKIFDGVAESVDIDLKAFGPRVRGIGDFPFVSQPFVSYGATGIFDDSGVTHREKGKLNVGVQCRYSDGTETTEIFASREELLRFQHEIKVAKQTGKGTVDLNGKTIILDDNFVAGMDEIIERISRRKRETEAESTAKHHYLLIYTNESELEYNEDAEALCIGEENYSVPNSLSEDITLRPHQHVGLKWLQCNYLMNRRGCLLADEMGLGKTLQVLTFLAWLIDRGDISPANANKDKAPWNPILVIAPVMLLENETWINDMKRFFKGNGSIFEPFITLHGAALRKFRLPDIAGRETDVERAVLDLNKLRQYRVILTNYETVTNYQYSFAMMRDQWSVVITDEAQEYKTPNTKISHALKSLSPKFRIACTGTPVETRLIDIWNIFDFLQPGRLGSAVDFTKQYERPIMDESGSDLSNTLGRLRDRLYFGHQTKAFVLRRDKTQLTDLPEKHEHSIFCDLTAEQCERHLDFIGRAREGGDGNHPFAMIHQLMRLYQHPDLLPEYLGLASSEVDQSCRKAPKLAKVMEILSDIRSKGEKALIFTRSLDMQQILATVISTKFNINVDIVNGGTSRKVSSRSSSDTRKSIISRFRNSAGFNVLVLSPEVAGVGLTLIEANHVIHYGRWWNPAKESQATDRIYRIGQTKDVHIYYPIARHPQRKFKSFDEKLDDLIRRRKDLAADFLSPMPNEDDMRKELLEDVMKGAESGTVRPLTQDDVRLLPWSRFEALIALLEEKRGKAAVLTPGSFDYGIDVISVEDKQAFLIQCKHTNSDISIDTDVVSDIMHALDSYRGRWLREVASNVVLKPVVVTNGGVTNSAVALARSRGVQLVNGESLRKLLSQTPCSLAEVEVMECRRMGTMKDVKTGVMKIVSR